MARRNRLSPQASSGRDEDRAPHFEPWLDRLLAAGCGMLLVFALLMPADSNSVTRGAALPFSLAALLLGLLAAASRSATSRLSWGPDLLLWATAAWMGWAALRTRGVGDVQAAYDTAAFWAGLAAWFSIVRTVTSRSTQVANDVRRALGIVLLSTAAGLATHAWYQYAVSMPRDRMQYQANPEAVLQQLGLDPTPGSIMRQRFEDRLNSTEPLATFALANSLAGALLAPLLICVALLMARRAEPPADKQRLAQPIILLALLLLLTSVLVLTKSRTAIIAAVLGSAALAFDRWSVSGTDKQGQGISRRTRGWIAIAIAVLAVGGTVALWRSDQLVILEAPKSLAFRLQYWRSALRLIGQHPLWGVGPGNFQSAYGRVREPLASEVIADPHQWWLEAAATGGLPAAWLLLAALAVPLLPRRSPSQSPEHPRRSNTSYCGVAVLVGALLALPVATLLGPAWNTPLDWEAWIVALPVAVVAAGLLGWLKLPVPALASGVLTGHLSGPLALIALAILLHLSGAGGLTVLGVAVPLWLLLALTSTMGAPREPTPADESRNFAVDGLGRDPTWGRIRLLLSGVLLIALAATYWSCFRPSVRSQSLTLEGQLRARLGAPVPDVAAAFQAAAAADPRSPELAMQWQQWAMLAVLEQDDPGRRSVLETADQRAVRTDPRSAALRLALGQRYLHLFQRWGRSDDLRRAASFCEEAAERLPTGTIETIQAAVTLQAAGQAAGDQAARRAARWAAVAEEISRDTPHPDQRVENVQVFAPLPRILSGPDVPPKTWNGSEALSNFRNAEGVVLPAQSVPRSSK
jgi:hypothetical protein